MQQVQSNESGSSIHGSILVVGGGIAGITAAVEAAECGYEVFLVEKEAYLGGRVAQLNKYFPKLCPPYCGLEINFQRIRNNRRIHFFTLNSNIHIKFCVNTRIISFFRGSN